jgi:hypothetical protein
MGGRFFVGGIGMYGFHFLTSGRSGATIGLPTGLGGSHTRGRNIETRELDHAEACPRTAAATDLTDAR